MKLILGVLLLASLSHSQIMMRPVWRGTQGLGTRHTDYTKDAACVGAWRMNGASTSMIEVDRSGHGNLSMAESNSSGTSLNVIPASSAAVPAGYSGFSRTFTRASSTRLDGVDGDARDISGPTAQVSVTAWINASATANGTVYVAAGKFGVLVPNPNRQYALYIQGSAAGAYKVVAAVSATTAGTSTTSLTSPASYADGEWHHVALVDDHIKLYLYVDGISVGTPVAHTGGLHDSEVPFSVGYSYLGGNAYFNGQIDDVGVFSRGLTPTEIAEIKGFGLDGRAGSADGAAPANPAYTVYYASAGAIGTFAENITEMNSLCAANPATWTCASGGTSVQSRDIRRVIITPAEYDYTVVIDGGIHGDEKASVRAVLDLLHYLAANPYARVRWVVTPMANPDAYVANGRSNANGVNLNRNFPTGHGVTDTCSPDPDANVEQPETTVLRGVITTYAPKWHISVHTNVNMIYSGPGANDAPWLRANTAAAAGYFGLLYYTNCAVASGKYIHESGAQAAPGPNGAYEYELGIRSNAEESNRFIGSVLATLQ